MMPFASGEVLRYEITWPSGLALGEAQFRAEASSAGWRFEADLGANMPTFEVADGYRSDTSAALCSVTFSKEIKHGKKATHEEVTFDQEARRATRVSVGGGGESEFATPPCARDALTYLYFLRSQLAKGRFPAPDDVNFGGQYMVNLTYVDSPEIEVGGERRTADHFLVDLNGPASQHSFAVFFGRDPARTPLLVRVRFEMGQFSLQLLP